jgi:hypothetical protein
LVPLLWFQRGLIIAGGDAPIYLDPAAYFENYVRYPVEHMNGVKPIEVCLIFPFLLFFWVFGKMGLAVVTIQKLLFVLYTATTGVSMYYLLRIIIPERDSRAEFGRLCGALFYMFNYFVILVNVMLTQYIAYALLPLLLGLFIRGTEASQSLTKRAVLFVIALSFLPVAFSNPPFLAVLVIILSLYALYDCVVINSWKNSGRILLFTGLSTVLYVLANAWFLLVWYVYFTSSGNVSEGMLPGYWNPGSTLNRTFVLQGSWAWNEMYFPAFYDYFEKTFFKLFLFVYPIGAFSVLLFPKLRRKVFFFVFLALIGIFFAKGRWGLFGGLYENLFEHVKLFWMFREPHTKFTLFTVLSYSVLLGIAVYNVCAKFMSVNRNKRLAGGMYYGMGTVVVCMILYQAWPLLSGDVISDKRGVIPSFHVKIPDGWNAAATQLNGEKGDFRILELPENKWAAIWLGWEHGFAAGGNPVSFLFHKATIHSPQLNLISRQVFYSLRKRTMTRVYKLLQLLHVKYLVQRNDYLWKTLQSDSPAQIAGMLSRQESLKKVASHGKLDVYENTAPTTLFSTAGGLTAIVGGAASLDALSCFYDFENMQFYFLRQFGKQTDDEYIPTVNRIIFYNSLFGDLVNCLIPERWRIAPADVLQWSDVDCARGWVPVSDLTKDPFTFDERTFLAGAYISAARAVFTASQAPLCANYVAETAGRYFVRVRWAAVTPDSRLRVSIDGKRIASLSRPAGGLQHIAWQDADVVYLEKGNHSVELAGAGGRILVDEIIVAPEEACAQVENKAKKLFDKGISLEYVVLNDTAASVTVPVYVPEESFRCEVLPLDQNATEGGAVSIDGKPIAFFPSGTALESDAFDLSAGEHLLAVAQKNLAVRLSPVRRDPLVQLPEMRIDRYGASRYLIKPTQSDTPFSIVFKAPYDVNWELYALAGDDVRKMRSFDLLSWCRPLRGAKKAGIHRLVNGYANGFLVYPVTEGTAYLLENRMQRVFETGMCISLATLACMIVYVVFACIRTDDHE